METNLELKSVEKISKALGDPYRVKIMEAIKHEKDWMPCARIVEMFDLAQSTVSHHIAQLANADLLVSEKDGKFARYKINKQVFGEYIKFLKSFQA